MNWKRNIYDADDAARSKRLKIHAGGTGGKRQEKSRGAGR